MAISLETMLKRDPRTVYAALGSDGVMLNIDAGLYHSVNDVGARIWELLETPKTAAELRDCLVEDFDVEPLVCQAAVLEFVGELRDRGIVHAEP